MVDIFIRPDQRTDLVAWLGSARSHRARIWTLICRLRGRIAGDRINGRPEYRTGRYRAGHVGDPVATDLGSRWIHAGARLSAVTSRRHRRPLWPPRSPARRSRDLRDRLVGADGIHQPPGDHRCPRCGGPGGGVHHARHHVAVNCRSPQRRTHQAVEIWAGVAGSGSVIGMLGSGVLLHFWSWQSIFWAFAGCAALIFVLAFTISTSPDVKATP